MRVDVGGVCDVLSRKGTARDVCGIGATSGARCRQAMKSARQVTRWRVIRFSSVVEGEEAAAVVEAGVSVRYAGVVLDTFSGARSW